MLFYFKINFKITRPVALRVGLWFSVRVFFTFPCRRKEIYIYFCYALRAYFRSMAPSELSDDYQFFWRTKNKKTYLIIIKQNTLRRIKIRFRVISWWTWSVRISSIPTWICQNNEIFNRIEVETFAIRMVGIGKAAVILWRSQCPKVSLWAFIAFHLLLSRVRREKEIIFLFPAFLVRPLLIEPYVTVARHIPPHRTGSCRLR